MEERPPIAFMSWRDLVITPLVWFGLLALAVVATVRIGPDGWLIPPPFRKLFYRLTGTRFGKGIISIGGRIADPHHLVTVEAGAIIGDDALILPHAIVLHPEHTVILRRVHIAAGAVVGAKSVVMPGVRVGERATIKAMSLVPTNSVIPPGEVWGGVPAAPQPSPADVRPERAQHAL